MAAALLVLAIAALLGGCAGSFESPELGGLYNQAAQHHGPERNPIVLIPGITGSSLVDASGRVVWGTFSGDYARPGNPADMRLLALPMEPGAPLSELRDGVRADRVLDRVPVRLLGIPILVRAYVQLLSVLGSGGYRDETLGRAGAVDYGSDHYTCFQFPYDWRRDNVESARQLGRFLAEKQAYVRKETRRLFGVDPGPVKLDVVAHSNGGLVLRYYLLYGDADLPADGSLPPVTWAGARNVERAIFVGPPNAGSLNIFIDLVRGHRPGPFMPLYPPALMGTFPAVYQLLPRGRHGVLLEKGGPDRRIEDLLDPALWERMGWGLASPGQDGVLAVLLPDVAEPAERRRIAREHLAKSLARARSFTAALDREPPPSPAHLKLYLIAGDAVPTASAARVDPRDGSLEVTARGPGDGTVLRTSALMDERAGSPWQAYVRSPVPWDDVLFLFTDHMGLTQDPVFADNVLFWLLEDSRQRRSRPDDDRSGSDHAEPLHPVEQGAQGDSQDPGRLRFVAPGHLQHSRDVLPHDGVEAQVLFSLPEPLQRGTNVGRL